MIGGIYSDQRCPECGGTFIDNGKTGLFCPAHKYQRATSFKVKFKKTLRRFHDYDAAHQFLNYLRALKTRNKYDERDYRKDNPLSFNSLSEKWLETKKDLRPRSFSAIENHIRRAREHFGQDSVKEIGFAQLEDFKISLSLKPKSIYNIFATLKEFFAWIKKRGYIRDYAPPEMPETPFQLGYRNITGKAEQLQILDEIRRLTWDYNPKIWFAVKLLCTYHAIRPGELLDINDGDWLFSTGHLRLTRTKTRTYRPVPMLEEDMEIARSFMDPKIDTRMLPFFRHLPGTKGTPAGHKFSKNIFYNWWVKACGNLGIKGLDLYGGTKHTTVTALREHFSPEEIKKAGFIETNKAFDRYLRVEGEDFRKVYRQSAADTKLTPILDLTEIRNHLKSNK